MKEVQGKTAGIAQTVLGRITLKPRMFGRTDYILVCEEAPKRCSGWAAVIAKNAAPDCSGPLCLVPSLEIFREGDVAAVNPEGRVMEVYEKNSEHNALMLTEQCNHRCLMCPQPPKNEKDDLTAYNLRLIDLIDKGTRELGITGGEPTLVGDDLFLIIEKLKAKLPNTCLTLLTNGVKFANPEYALKLARIQHPDLQIDVPIFSDVASLHNEIVGAKTFYRTVQGLYNLARFNQRIGLRIVLHKLTYRRLPQLAEYIYRNFPFVTQVAFMQMENAGLVQENFERLWIDPFDYNDQLKDAVLLLQQRGLHPVIYNAQLCILPVELRQFAVQSISDWKDIYITECDGCSLRGSCAGFFLSNKQQHSLHIKSC